ncbi:MAG TPA: efflux transporter periplasmic adaptor subunit, partial [Thermoanaerobaculia bacterium]|nr:efflux transporter periplasmic adaptor subunit [Thermoanaerobaculia bacterium]
TAALPPNASVNVQIIVGEKPSALVIPRGALMRDGDQRFVFQYSGGKAKRTPVQVGLIGPNDVEVLRGVKEGDRVILPGSSPLQDGESVRVTS